MEASAVAALRQELECPICFDVPREQKIFQCQNSHAICEACYSRLDSAAKNCPQGKCEYQTPEPARNRIAERMIERCDFSFSCKHSKGGCGVEMKKSELAKHESECLFRIVECPSKNCQEMVSMRLKKLNYHINTAHKEKILNAGKCSPMVANIPIATNEAFTNDGLNDGLLSIESIIWDAEESARFCMILRKTNGLLNVWVYIFGSPMSAKEWKVAIEILGQNRKLLYECDVNSIDVAAVDVQQNGHLLILDTQQVKNLITHKELSEEMKNNGWDAHIKIKVKVIRANPGKKGRPVNPNPNPNPNPPNVECTEKKT